LASLFPPVIAEAAAVITRRHKAAVPLSSPARLARCRSLGRGVTPPVMLGIMDLGYLDARSRARLALTRLSRPAADTTTLEG